MADLKADKDRSDLRYSTARKIGKLLSELPKEDVPVVVQHVALEHGLTVAIAMEYGHIPAGKSETS